jgi:cytoskeletal protein CcmA (bactofilin family)
MFGWKKDRDYRERLDMEVTPWELGKQDVPPRPIEPRVDVPLTGARPPVGGMARRLAEVVGPTARRTELRPAVPAADEGKRLIVGRDIVLTGEIKACDRLVVEGRVEAALSDIRTVEITSSGVLKGAAQVDSADIAGSYEGDLTVQHNLHIRATGRVHGHVRYGSIEIERGGRIGGQVEALAKEPVVVRPPEAPATTPRIQVDVDETEDAE